LTLSLLAYNPESEREELENAKEKKGKENLHPTE
jgi:hypothetical protein